MSAVSGPSAVDGSSVGSGGQTTGDGLALRAAQLAIALEVKAARAADGLQPASRGISPAATPVAAATPAMIVDVLVVGTAQVAALQALLDSEAPQPAGGAVRSATGVLDPAQVAALVAMLDADGARPAGGAAALTPGAVLLPDPGEAGTSLRQSVRSGDGQRPSDGSGQPVVNGSPTRPAGLAPNDGSAARAAQLALASEIHGAPPSDGGRPSSRGISPTPNAGPATAVEVIVVDKRQGAAIVALLKSEEVPLPPESVVRSAAGVVGRLVEAAPSIVMRAALEVDHTGTQAKAFAVQVGDGRVVVVIVQTDWSGGLRPGRAGADQLRTVLEAALDDAFAHGAATENRPRVDVRAASADAFVLNLLPPLPGEPPPKVGPVLDNVGFSLLFTPWRGLAGSGLGAGGGLFPFPATVAGLGVGAVLLGVLTVLAVAFLAGFDIGGLALAGLLVGGLVLIAGAIGWGGRDG